MVLSSPRPFFVLPSSFCRFYCFYQSSSSPHFLLAPQSFNGFVPFLLFHLTSQSVLIHFFSCAPFPLPPNPYTFISSPLSFFAFSPFHLFKVSISIVAFFCLAIVLVCLYFCTLACSCVALSGVMPPGRRTYCIFGSTCSKVHVAF